MTIQCLLLVIEQNAGPQHGEADPHLYLAKGEVQTMWVASQPGRWRWMRSAPARAGW